jgi:hypothetical protein
MILGMVIVAGLLLISCGTVLIGKYMGWTRCPEAVEIVRSGIYQTGDHRFPYIGFVVYRCVKSFPTPQGAIEFAGHCNKRASLSSEVSRVLEETEIGGVAKDHSPVQIADMDS